MDYSSVLSQNPSSTSTASMSPSNSAPIHQQQPETEPESLIRESPDPPKPDGDASQEKVPEDSIEAGSGGGEEEEGEEGECGFCLFMKAGGCKETFTDWEKCVEEGEKNKEDIVEKCFQVTSALKKCMEAHSDYYAPLLEAEAAAAKQLEEENQKEKADQAASAAEEKLGDSAAAP